MKTCGILISWNPLNRLRGFTELIILIIFINYTKGFIKLCLAIQNRKKRWDEEIFLVPLTDESSFTSAIFHLNCFNPSAKTHIKCFVCKNINNPLIKSHLWHVHKKRKLFLYTWIYLIMKCFRSLTRGRRNRPKTFLPFYYFRSALLNFNLFWCDFWQDYEF